MIRPTKYTFHWELQADYGYGEGWECVCAEERYSQARIRRREYRDNGDNAPMRIVRKRETVPNPAYVSASQPATLAP